MRLRAAQYTMFTWVQIPHLDLCISYSVRAHNDRRCRCRPNAELDQGGVGRWGGSAPQTDNMNYFDSEPLAVNPLQYSGKLMTWTELFEMIRSGRSRVDCLPFALILFMRMLSLTCSVWCCPRACVCTDITKDLKWQAKRALIGRLITPWRRSDKDKKGGEKM